jgi:hypothetical protein
MIWNKRSPYLVIVVVSAVVVCLAWAALAAFGFRSLSAAGGLGIERLGQFGDTFGSLNALFTGLALAGLVYGGLLQRKQLDDQQRDSEENHHALIRQSRELFLTARLNATAALLQAHDTTANLSIATRDRFLQEVALRESRNLRQQIGILLCEANLGFDREDWSTLLEEQAILDYLTVFFRGLESRCGPNSMNGSGNAEENAKYTKSELLILYAQINERHHEIAEKVLHYSNLVSPGHTQEQLNEAIGNVLASLSEMKDRVKAVPVKSPVRSA